MFRKITTRGGLISAAVLSWVAGGGAHAQAPARAGHKAEDAYKNIQALRGTPAEDFNQTMHLMSGALGVDCEYCHVSQKDRVSDDMKAKVVARDMIKMTADLNRKSFHGQQVVTCYTCHRGNPVPPGAPVLPDPGYIEEKKPPAGLPAADQIVAKYIQALGGEQALQKVTSRRITATQDIPTGPGGVNPVPAQMERFTKAPYFALTAYRAASFSIANGFDGNVAWAQDQRGRVTQPVKLEQLRARRNADFYEPLHLKQEYTQMKVEGIEKVNGRDAYAVLGIPQEKIPERLYFDAQSGLLLRKATRVPTAIGDSPYEVDYDDYRDTGHGAKFPFLIHMEPAGPRLELITHSTIRVLTVEDNVAIDDVKFVQPVSKEEPPPPAAKGSKTKR